MKSLLAIAIAVAVVLVLPAVVAATGTTHKGTPHLTGTISSWDEATKQGTVKDSSGKEHSFTWNDQTVVSGAPKVGEHASVTYKKDKDGKMTATQIHIGAKTTSTKTTTK